MSRVPIAVTILGNFISRLGRNRLVVWGVCCVFQALFSFDVAPGQGHGLPDSYGRSSGAGYYESVNGTSLLAERFRQTGRRVITRRALTLSVAASNTIVWFPDSFELPSQTEWEWLENWLLQDVDRTLVIVGRDYEALTDYWEEQIQRQTGPAKLAARRQWALARSQWVARNRPDHEGSSRAEDNFWNWKPPVPRSQWFQISPTQERRISHWSGDWDDSAVGDSEARLAGSGRSTAPREESRFTAGRWGTERWEFGPEADFDFVDVVSEGDGEAYAWRGWLNGSQVILVANGSRLLNYPLTFPENQRWADHLVESCATEGTIVFLESGAEGLPIRENEAPPTAWSWIAERPFSYLAPHFLVWGVWICFVVFPILGRPRRGLQVTRPGFRQHLVAVGRLLRRAPPSLATLDRGEAERGSPGPDAPGPPTFTGGP